MRKIKVFLRPDEKLVFARAALQARATGQSWVEALAQANLAMPENRRVRSANHPVAIKWLPGVLAAISNEPALAGSQGEPVAQAAPAPAEPVAQATPAPAEPVAQATLPEPAPQPAAPLAGARPLDALHHLILDAIVGSVKDAVHEIVGSPDLRAAIVEALRAPPQAVAQATQRVVAAARPVKPTVAVVGLLPIQANQVQSDFGDEFDLRFVSADTPTPQIRASVGTSDYVVMASKFVSHRVQDALRGHPGFRYCNGGVSAMGDILKGLQQKAQRGGLM